MPIWAIIVLAIVAGFVAFYFYCRYKVHKWWRSPECYGYLEDDDEFCNVKFYDDALNHNAATTSYWGTPELSQQDWDYLADMNHDGRRWDMLLVGGLPYNWSFPVAVELMRLYRGTDGKLFFSLAGALDGRAGHLASLQMLTCVIDGRPVSKRVLLFA